MTIPSELHEDFLALISHALDAIAQADRAIAELDSLLETGFRGNEVKLVEGMIAELGRLEHESDEMQAKMRQRLFQIEQQLPPIDAIFLYKVLNNIGI